MCLQVHCVYVCLCIYNSVYVRLCIYNSVFVCLYEFFFCTHFNHPLHLLCYSQGELAFLQMHWTSAERDKILLGKCALCGMCMGMTCTVWVSAPDMR